MSQLALYSLVLAKVRSFAHPSGTFELGNLIGVDEASGGTMLLDQQVASVAGENLAIGRVVQREGSAATSVRIQFVSTVIFGGPTTAA